MPPLTAGSEATSRASAISALGGTTTTGQGARRETSAEMLPSKDERAP